MKSNLNGALFLFKTQVEDAVSLVPSMNSDDKLQAVNIWNRLSEKLQDIVNNSAADINNSMDIQRNETDNVKFDSTAAQNEKELNDNLESLIKDSNNELSNLTDDQLIFDNQTELLDDNLNNNIADTLGNNLQNDINNLNGITDSSNNLNGDLSNDQINLSNEQINLSNELNNLTQQDNNQFMNTSNELNLEDISNFTSNLELNDQPEIISNDDDQMKDINSSQPLVTQTMQKDLFNFDQFQRDHQLRTDNDKQQNCDLESNNLNLIQSIATNSNDSGFISCNSNGCVDQHQLASNFMTSNPHTNAYLNNQLNRISINPQIQHLVNPTSDKSDHMIDDTPNVPCSGTRNDGINANSSNNLDSTLIVTNMLNINDKEEDKQRKSTKTTKYSCDKCSSLFSTKSNLIVHQRKHTGEKPYTCNIDDCCSSFSTKGNLKRHIKAHTGEKPYSCNECSACFTEKKSLKVHLRRHTGERPYQCPLCSKRFSQTGVLQTHMTLHSDERKFLCLICSKKFRQKSQLRLHQLRHEGIKKFHCTNCSSRFLTKGDLERHSRTHSGERPFKCDLCFKTFTRQQSKNEHENRFHYHLKPYECNTCEKRFVEMSSCYKHIKIHKRQQNQTVDNDNLSSLNDNGNKCNEDLLFHRPTTSSRLEN